MTFPKLKPCPFCGSKVDFIPIANHDDTRKSPTCYDIACPSAKCFMTNGAEYAVSSQADIQEIADMWNNRYDNSR